MSSNKEVFRAVLQAYDLAIVRTGTMVESHQRSVDLFNLITEFSRQNQERLAVRRERKRLADEKKARREEIANNKITN
jgi:hypothetical protein